MGDHHTLIDTCVWLDLASDPAADEIVARLEDLIATTRFRLVVPQVVREEFDRHKAECTVRLAKRMADRVKETIRYANQFGEARSKADLIAGLQAFVKRIEDVANGAATVVTRIEALLDDSETRKLETTPELLRKSAQRGYEKKAPFSSGKNSTADAIILESYLDFYHRHEPGKCSFSFVTLNKSDFADPKDQRRPHPDLDESFATSAIRYSINLADEINRLTSELPPAPKREKKLLSEEIVRRVDFWPGDHRSPGICPACGARALVEGGWRGHTWHKRCTSCGSLFDTGESIDD
ncbi:MAG TPA: PIN domain-containing protein [Nitrospira sp.]|nr:PIN domain-containing protein [Nitrospira sp.]